MISLKIKLLSMILVVSVMQAACALTPSASSPQVANPPAAAAPADTAQPAQPAQPIANLSSDEVVKAVHAAYAALEKSGPRHVSQTSYEGSTPSMNIEADTVPPNLHQIVSVNGQVMAEQYIMNGAIYAKVEGSWKKSPGSVGQFAGTLAGMGEGLKDQIVYSDGKVLGVENVNGKPATAYSYKVTLKGLSAAPTTHNVWVDVSSGLPVKQEIIKDGGEKTVQLITFNPGLAISLPAEAAAAPLAN